jgi:hypothetical protein
MAVTIVLLIALVFGTFTFLTPRRRTPTRANALMSAQDILAGHRVTGAVIALLAAALLLLRLLI